jgi:hypothetical protein
MGMGPAALTLVAAAGRGAFVCSSGEKERSPIPIAATETLSPGRVWANLSATFGRVF